MITKEAEIKAYAKELADLQSRGEMGDVASNSLVEELKAKLIEKQTLIEKLQANSISEDNSLDCNELRLKQQVFKKIEHCNSAFEERMQQQVHSHYKKEIIKLSDDYFQQIDKLKRELAKTHKEYRSKI